MSRIVLVLTVLAVSLVAAGARSGVAHADTPASLDGGQGAPDVEARDQCFDTDFGKVCIADPPPPPACAPNCPAPAWHPPYAGNITLCHLYGYCQNYCNGVACGQPYKPTDPLYGPWQHLIQDERGTIYFPLFTQPDEQFPSTFTQYCGNNAGEQRYIAC